MQETEEIFPLSLFFIFPVKLLPEGLLMNIKYSSKISGQKICYTADHLGWAKD